MAAYTPPLRDIDFVLHDVLEVQESPIPGYAELDRDTTARGARGGGRIAARGAGAAERRRRRQGCRLENGVVRTPAGFREAYATVAEGGWIGLDLDPDYGGQGMPHVLNTAVGEMHAAANMALNMYWGLTPRRLQRHPRPRIGEQKAAYLPKLVSGEWSGTMNLTEPHCRHRPRAAAHPRRAAGRRQLPRDRAEDLHLGRRARPDREHRAPGAGAHPRGAGGREGHLALHRAEVPRRTPTAASATRNALSCGKIEEKMGIHGNSTCVMNYDCATGWLVGEAHKGLRACSP